MTIFIFISRIHLNDEMRNRIALKRQENASLDKRIQKLNLSVSEKQLVRNIELEEREARESKDRLKSLSERARLVRQVQHQHAQIIELSTVLELQRLKTFPTLCVAVPAPHKK